VILQSTGAFLQKVRRTPRLTGTRSGLTPAGDDLRRPSRIRRVARSWTGAVDMVHGCTVDRAKRLHPDLIWTARW
jgi:hypothetical protein